MILTEIFGFSGLRKLQKIQKRFMTSNDEDHPRVREIRRRIVEVVTELDQENLL